MASWGEQEPDFGAGYTPQEFYSGGRWRTEDGGGREIGSTGWQGYLRAFNPAELNRFKIYQSEQKSKYYSPYAQAQRTAGGASGMLTDLIRDPSKIQQTAGYQFQKGQGEEAINRSAAAKGMLGSGNVLAELAKYGQGMASQEYGNQVSRLSGLLDQSQKFMLGANADPRTAAALNPAFGGITNPSRITSW